MDEVCKSIIDGEIIMVLGNKNGIDGKNIGREQSCGYIGNRGKNEKGESQLN